MIERRDALFVGFKPKGDDMFAEQLLLPADDLTIFTLAREYNDILV